MAESGDANFLEILSCKLGQKLSSNRMSRKAGAYFSSPRLLSHASTPSMIIAVALVCCRQTYHSRRRGGS